MEQRRSVRYEVRLPCRIRIGNGHEEMHGMTLNVGCSGALVAVTDVSTLNGFGPGDPIKVSILLPPNPMFGQRTLDCEGSIVRLHEESGTPVVGIQFEQAMFNKSGIEPQVAASAAVM